MFEILLRLFARNGLEQPDIKQSGIELALYNGSLSADDTVKTAFKWYLLQSDSLDDIKNRYDDLLKWMDINKEILYLEWKHIYKRID